MSTPGTPVKEVYAIFCGSIGEITAQRASHWLAQVTQGGFQHLHLLFQSSGGLIGDGVFLYNLFRGAPIDLSFYNAGQILSAGVTAYLGAKHRIASPRATFMIHLTKSMPQLFTSAQLENAAKNLAWDDERTKEIIKESATKIPEEIWKQFDLTDVFLTGREAVDYGIATELGEFAPPPGAQLLDFIA